MTLWSSVDCSEVHGTRKDGRSWKGGPSASVTLQTTYANRTALADDLLQNGYWPFTPVGKSAPRVQSVEFEYLPTDYTQDEQAIVYKEVNVNVQYGFDDSAGGESGGGSGGGRQLYTETISPILEVVSVMDMEFSWKFQNTGEGLKDYALLDEKNLPTLKEYSINIERTFFNWISVPLSFLNLIGYINDAEVTMLGLTMPAETLKFVPRQVSRTVSSDGTDGFNVQVLFQYKKSGWNKFPIPDEATGGVSRETLYLRPKDSKLPLKEFKPYPVGDFSDWVF